MLISFDTRERGMVWDEIPFLNFVVARSADSWTQYITPVPRQCTRTIWILWNTYNFFSKAPATSSVHLFFNKKRRYCGTVCRWIVIGFEMPVFRLKIFLSRDENTHVVKKQLPTMKCTNRNSYLVIPLTLILYNIWVKGIARYEPPSNPPIRLKG